MDWKDFLQVFLYDKQYSLTPSQINVLMCLDECRDLSTKELRESYSQRYGIIGTEAFAQRLRIIYQRFNITGNGYRLPQLTRLIREKYVAYKRKDAFFSDIGLSHIYQGFPREDFQQAILDTIESEDSSIRHVDILQTFAPNLNDFKGKLILCLESNVPVRILLAWPYSNVAKLREEVLKKYSFAEQNNDFNICNEVIDNLFTLEKIIQYVGNTNLLEIRLYDTLPSVAIYRAGNYMLAGVFLHGSLAIDTFQLELNTLAPNRFIADTLLNDFDILWNVARSFTPHPNTNWINDLRILFHNQPPLN